ncbi:MAG: phytanoyl-CoA dioxygenase family protein [Alphaproteobacteria bacterium]
MGRPVETAMLGALADSAPLVGQPGALAARLERDGYLFLRGAVAPALADAARHGVFGRLAEMDEVVDPAGDTRATGRSRRAALAPDKGVFWQAVSEQPAMRAVTHGPALRALMSEILGVPARPFDFVFLRPGVTGRHTDIHCDKPFFTRETERVVTCWIALGPVPVERGPLFVVEGSHRWPDVRAAVEGYDVARDRHRRNALTEHPGDFAAARGTRLLTADFRPGDLVVFAMYLLHGAFENHAADGGVRLSCDVRFQPEADACDPRYFGPHPTGTTGAGYGELNGAKPLTEEWHQR